jgi:general stress protein CsbA
VAVIATGLQVVMVEQEYYKENTQNYWVLGLCPSSGILEARKHSISETGSVSVLR